MHHTTSAAEEIKNGEEKWPFLQAEEPASVKDSLPEAVEGEDTGD